MKPEILSVNEILIKPENRKLLRAFYEKTAFTFEWRIIHIAPKKTEKLYAGKLSGTAPREIEWSHSWFSRGHWRRLEPGHIGKNRNGDYVESGRTWVTDSIKGPDHLPMVKKTYVVDGESC